MAPRYHAVMVRTLVRLAKPVIEHFPKAAQTLRHLRDSRLLSSEPVKTPLGWKFVGNKTMQDGTFEPEETRLVQALLDKISLLVDVGANIGYYCCMGLQRGKRIIAFEPIWLNVQYLLRNVDVNGWRDRIEVHHLALSDRVGVTNIFGGGTGASLVEGWARVPEHYTSMVPSSTLDTILGDRLRGEQALIIIDVEGAEKLVLSGAQGALQNTPKPILMIEIVVEQKKGIGRNKELLSTFDMLWNAGYESFTATDQRRAVTRHEIEAVQKSGVNTLGTYNFLFIEHGRSNEFLV